MVIGAVEIFRKEKPVIVEVRPGVRLANMHIGFHAKILISPSEKLFRGHRNLI
jgi:hypothetical protein